MKDKQFKQLVRAVSSHIFQEIKDDLEICPDEESDEILENPDVYTDSFMDIVNDDLDKLMRRYKVAKKDNPNNSIRRGAILLDL